MSAVSNLSDMNPELPTGRLTFKEFGVLANLLRRFEMHHVEPDGGRAIVMDTELLVKNVYCDLYVPNSKS